MCSRPHQSASGNALLEAARTFCRGIAFPVPPAELEQLFMSDKMFPQLFCSLLFSSQGSLTQRYFNCPHTNTTPAGFALLEEVRSLWPSRTTLAEVFQYFGKETRKANRSNASKKGQGKQGKGTQTQPCPERFVQKLQRNCSPEVLYQGLSDFFLSCILQSVLWGASKAQTSDSII